MNPQIRFGEDLMSRVSYVMMNPGGAAELTRVVRATMDGLIGELAREARVARDEMFEATIVGNPIMHHLFLGLDPTELGGAPFALTIDGGFEARAGELGLSIAPGAFVYALPCIAGHVGADAAGMTLAEAPYLRDELTLLVDVGTNAEIVFGNQDAACSPVPRRPDPPSKARRSPAANAPRPARSNACASTLATLEPRYKVIGSDLWSDEPGFAEATAKTIGVSGVCGSGIIEAIAEMYLAGIVIARRRHRRRARREVAAHRGGRPHVLLCAPRRRAAAPHPSDRRARHPARQGGALRRRAIADRDGSPPGRRSASRSPALSAATSTRFTRWRSASFPIAI